MCAGNDAKFKSTVFSQEEQNRRFIAFVVTIDWNAKKALAFSESKEYVGLHTISVKLPMFDAKILRSKISLVTSTKCENLHQNTELMVYQVFPQTNFNSKYYLTFNVSRDVFNTLIK